MFSQLSRTQIAVSVRPLRHSPLKSRSLVCTTYYSTLPNTPPTNAGFLQNDKNLMWMAGAGLFGIGTWWYFQRNESARKKLIGVKEQVKQGEKH